jgi:hypothetical protein
MSIKILYDDNSSWEKDYIKELFSNITCEIIYINNFKNKLVNEDEIINNNILVFSSNIYTFQ